MKNLTILFICSFLLCICMETYGQGQGQPANAVLNNEFLVSPDTLFFLEPDDFVEGKEFSIFNPNSDTVFITHIDQSGDMNCYCAPWFVNPFIYSFPVSIGPNDSLKRTVRFAAIDQLIPGGLAYDSLFIQTLSDTSWIILVADSTYISIGMDNRDPFRTQIYPNPFSGSVTILISATQSMPVTLRILNTTLQPVKTLAGRVLVQGENRQSWDGTNDQNHPVPPGLYFLEVKSTYSTKILKILKN